MNSIEITNISPVLDQSHLKELFNCCGTITQISTTHNAHNQRICHVTFSDPSEAEAAALLSGTQLGDAPIQVAVIDNSNIHTPVTPVENEEMFTEAGDHVPMETPTSVNDALKMMKAMANAPPPEPKAAVEAPNVEHMSEEQRMIARTVYLGNLNPLVTEAHLKSVFATCGPISYIKLCPVSTNIDMPNYAFLEFISIESALRAFGLNGTALGDRPLRVSKANSHIVKPGMPGPSKGVPLTSAMASVKDALSNLKNKFTVSSRSGSKSFKRKRSHRSSSRSSSKDSYRSRNSRRRRSHSRRRRRPRSSTSRSTSRSPYRSPQVKIYTRTELNSMKMKQLHDDKNDMVWDGFRWLNKNSIEGEATLEAAERTAAGIHIQHDRALNMNLPQQLAAQAIAKQREKLSRMQ